MNLMLPGFCRILSHFKWKIFKEVFFLHFELHTLLQCESCVGVLWFCSDLQLILSSSFAAFPVWYPMSRYIINNIYVNCSNCMYLQVTRPHTVFSLNPFLAVFCLCNAMVVTQQNNVPVKLFQRQYIYMYYHCFGYLHKNSSTANLQVNEGYSGRPKWNGEYHMVG